MVRERFPTVRVIDAGANLGFARANNIGIKATTSELVLLLNPDTIVPPAAIDAMAAQLVGSSDVVAIVQPLVGSPPQDRVGTRWTRLQPDATLDRACVPP